MHLQPLLLSNSNSNSNQILQPNLAGANPSGAHFTNPGPQFSSIVGGVTGCGGAGGSAAALAGNPGYNISMKGGLPLPMAMRMRRAGAKSRKGGKSNKRHGSRSNNRKVYKCRGKNCVCGCKCRGKSCKCSCHRSRKGHMSHRMRGGRGDLSATAAPFNGGANLPYHQYMSNIPNSPVFSVGSDKVLPNSGMANPPPISVQNACGK